MHFSRRLAASRRAIVLANVFLFLSVRTVIEGAAITVIDGVAA